MEETQSHTCLKICISGALTHETSQNPTMILGFSAHHEMTLPNAKWLAFRGQVQALMMMAGPCVMALPGGSIGLV